MILYEKSPLLSAVLEWVCPALPPDLVLRHRKVVQNYYRKYLGNYHAAYLRDLAQRIPMAPELESVLMSSFVDTLMRMGGKEGGWGRGRGRSEPLHHCGWQCCVEVGRPGPHVGEVWVCWHVSDKVTGHRPSGQ